MNDTPLNARPAPLEFFADEVLRWNRRINLISRQDPEQTLHDLLEQCLGGFASLWPRLCAWGWGDASSPAGTYWDLGSGAGLPGVVWHHQLAAQGVAVQTVLVEPRDKRAWFLERLAQSAHWPPFLVFQDRWGKNPRPMEAPLDSGHHLISLKALHLTDPEVLEGLGAMAPGIDPLSPGCEVVVARFYPSEQEMDPALVQHLAMPAPGEMVEHGDQKLTLHGAEILKWARPGPRTASLVVNRYRVT